MRQYREDRIGEARSIAVVPFLAQSSDHRRHQRHLLPRVRSECDYGRLRLPGSDSCDRGGVGAASSSGSIRGRHLVF